MNIEIAHLLSLLKIGVMTIQSSLIQQLKHNKTAAVAVNYQQDFVTHQHH